MSIPSPNEFREDTKITRLKCSNITVIRRIVKSITTTTSKRIIRILLGNRTLTIMIITK